MWAQNGTPAFSINGVAKSLTCLTGSYGLGNSSSNYGLNVFRYVGYVASGSVIRATGINSVAGTMIIA